MRVCNIWNNDLTEYQVWYKLTELWKAFRQFLTASRKKTFQRISSYNSGRKRKLWTIFLPRIRLWKSKHREAGLQNEKRKQGTFRDTLILFFVNENCCLRICFTELYFFYWLLVASLTISIAVPLVFSRSWTLLAGVLKMQRVSNAFEDYRLFGKPFNKE